MSKRSLLLLLVLWNVLLTAAMVWSLGRNRVPERLFKERLNTVTAQGDSVPATALSDAMRAPEASIAFFFMDSVQSNFELVQESAERVRNEGQRMENNLQKEMAKAQARYNELMSKDHTYSTQAELQADQAELEALGTKIQDMRISAQDQLDRMQVDMLQEITAQIKGFLENYNATAQYDYIFSIQDAGQIWVGNKGLNITAAVVDGLNAQHRARNAAKDK